MSLLRSTLQLTGAAKQPSVCSLRQATLSYGVLILLGVCLAALLLLSRGTHAQEPCNSSLIDAQQHECAKITKINRGAVAREVVLHGVDFAPDSYQLRPRAERILDQVAQSLIAQNIQSIEIGSHTDKKGSESAKMELSDRRAHTVRTYLIRKGVDRARLSAIGYGWSQPVADNGTDIGRKANRRVVLRLWR